jgi:hypothetical protein
MEEPLDGQLYYPVLPLISIETSVFSFKLKDTQLTNATAIGLGPINLLNFSRR